MYKNNDTHISNLLQRWYLYNHRQLPWRATSNPYLIWVSEIILQQTQVVQGYPYYLRFVDRFPDIKSLATASEEEVLKIWQGLGYYSRARNMLEAARQMMELYDGRFPKEYAEIRGLMGVGDYTAAAVGSVAFNLPYAAVDGNVYRVLSRIFLIEEPIDTTKGKKLFNQIAQSIIDEENPGIHNQAIMELGAMVCSPAKPKCFECPLQYVCVAHAKKREETVPVKSKKIKQRIRYFNYFNVFYKDNIFLQKRVQNDIWKNLFDFPLIETTQQTDLEVLMNNSKFKEWFSQCEALVFTHQSQMTHVLTHQKIIADFYSVEINSNECFEKLNDVFIAVSYSSVGDYPIPRLTHKYMETILRDFL